MEALRNSLTLPRANEKTTDETGTTKNKSKYHVVNGSDGRFQKVKFSANQLDDPSNNADEEPLDQRNGLLSSSKKIQKKKLKPQLEKYKLLSIGFPMEIKKEADLRGVKPFSTTRRYSVRVEYLDEKGVKRLRHVRFGKNKDEEYVDSGNNLKRMQTINRLANTDNWLHENFYRVFLLNTSDRDIHAAYKNMKTLLNI